MLGEAAVVIVGLGVGFAGLAMLLGALVGVRPPREDPPAGAPALADLLAARTGRKARVDPYSLGHFDTNNLSEAEHGLRFAVDGLCPSVTLWRLGFSTPLKVDPTDAWPVGDLEFDSVFRVVGRPAEILALLTARTRGALHGLVRGSVRLGHLGLEGGTLGVDVPISAFSREHPGLQIAAHAIAELALLLAAPPDVVGRLAEGATLDAAPGVRVRCLRVLLGDHAAHPETRAALGVALRDADEGVRLEAALGARAQGRETLVQLAIDTNVSDRCGARAVEALGADLPLDRVESLVRESAKVPDSVAARPSVTRAFILALGRNRSEAALQLLARLILGAHDSYGPDIADAIVAGSRPGAEAALVAALGTWALDRTHATEAAAAGLADVGTADAVLPLKDAARRHGGRVAEAARRSVAAIQARINSTPGRLALADGEGGRLSEVDDPSGRVTLPDQDD